MATTELARGTSSLGLVIAGAVTLACDPAGTQLGNELGDRPTHSIAVAPRPTHTPPTSSPSPGHERSDTTTRSQRPPPPEPPARPRDTRADASPRRPAIDASGLGFAIGEPPLSVRGRTHNRKGLKFHRKGAFARAEAEFRKAITSDPNHDLARFNLACSLAKQRKFDGISELLQELLSRDLPRFGPRLRNDADLAAFRSTARGQTLIAQLDARETNWIAALSAGVETIVWEPPKRAIEDREYGVYLPPKHLRIGVLWAPGPPPPKNARFIPAGPVMQTQHAAALADSKREVIGFSGDAASDMSSVFHRSHRFVGSSRSHAWTRELAEGKPEQAYWAIDLRPGPDGIELRALPSSTRDQGRPDPFALPRNRSARAIHTLHVVPEGSLILAQPPAPVEMTATQIRGVAANPLDWPAAHGKARYRSAIIEDHHAYLASTWYGCHWEPPEEDEPTPVLRHHLDRIDLRNGAVKTLSKGAGAVSIRKGPKGTIWVQVGDTLQTVEPTRARLRVVRGLSGRVLLHVPLKPKVCFDP